MRICRTFASLFLVATASLFSQTPAAKIDYTQQVHPLLAARCLTCHSQDKRSGGLSLATYQNVLDGGRAGAAIRPGRGADSLLIQRVSGEIQPRMPLAGAPLSDTEIAMLRLWIDQGARETPGAAAAKPKWEAPLALTMPTVPPQIWKGWNAPLDRFTAAYLTSSGVPQPPPLVSDTIFAKRVYLDIWGLLPTPGQLRAFTKDRSPAKRSRLVETLLADNQKYAENWISFWNDLLRNDEGVTYHSETASRKSISAWLLGALNANLSYDQFAAKLLAPAAPTDPDGFLVGVNWRGTVSASQTPAMQAAQNTAQVFLGINLKCNSCHDSFISHWKLKDAYSLAGYFSSEPKLQLYRCDVAQEQFAEPAYLYASLNRTPASGSVIDRRSAAAAIFTDPRNGRFPRTLVNRFWARFFGRGIVENVDEMDGEPWSPELLDWLAGDFVANHYDMKHLIAVIASSGAYQLPSVPREAAQVAHYVFRGPEVRRLTAEQFADAVASITGDWHVYQPSPFDAAVLKETDDLPIKPGVYAREWRVAATSLTRALGRPIRDQVYTTRDTDATTLQALELVNGETLTHWLSRGARNMLGTLPPEPQSLFDRPLKGRTSDPPFDIDIAGSKKLWLLVQDAGSYSPERVEAIWGNAELVGPNGVTPLSSLKPTDDSGLRTAESPILLRGAGSPIDGVRVKTPSRLVYDLNGVSYTRLRGIASFENVTFTDDISPQVRFFVFNQEPNMEHLTTVDPTPPLPETPPIESRRKLVDRIFWYALGRAPSPAERRAGEAALADPAQPRQPSADGLADLLWAVLMKPEFQLIY